MKHVFFLLIFICFFVKSIASFQWEFPKNLGKHPDFNVEWWYLTGHFTDETDKQYGLQLTFFRRKVDTIEGLKSIFNSAHVYSAHVALSDIDSKTFYHDELFARPGFSPISVSEERLDIKVKNWLLYQKGDQFIAQIPASFGTIEFHVEPAKNKVFHGQNGKSFKGPDPDQFSYYFSYPKLSGHVTVNYQEKQLSSKSLSLWMDREIFDQSVNDKQAGWDWFALQLDNGTELMCFQVRGKTDAYNFKSGTFIDQNSISTPLKSDDILFRTLKTWQSKESGICYPIAWEIKILSLNKTFTIEAKIPNQELHVSAPFDMHYWEGACYVSGSESGHAYMELVGYQNK